jgi:tetratricopeptide (TPR) repeat protein
VSVPASGPQDRERYEAVIADLIAEAGGTDDPSIKVDCLREAASIYERQLQDLPKALLAWLAAFAEAPTNEDSALAVERLAEALKRWDDILADVDSLIADVSDREDQAALLLWIARWQDRFAKDAVAAEQRLSEAAALAPSSAAVAEAQSAFHRRREEWAKAAEPLVRAGSAATDVGDAVGLLIEAARLYEARLKDSERAGQLYRRVLELSPTNAVAAEALAEGTAAGVDPVAMCAQYRRAHEVDPENLTIVRQWADVAFAQGRWDDVRFLFDYLFNRAGGGVRPDSRARLNDALDRFVTAGRWQEAIDVLRTLAREANGALAAKYYLAAGKIAHHELKDEKMAVELFGRSLDENPHDLATFERIYTIYSNGRAWQQAETQLKLMIDRLRAVGKADDAGVMVPLWRRLGDLYRSGLRDLAAAAEAYRECARLVPEDRYARLVAELTDRQGTAKR